MFSNGLVRDEGLAWACNNLGNLYSDRGKATAAEEMYQRALQGYKKEWGPKYRSTFNAVNNSGTFYKSQNRLAEAEEMYLQALRGHERTSGFMDKSTLNTVNNLGLL